MKLSTTTHHNIVGKKVLYLTHTAKNQWNKLPGVIKTFNSNTKKHLIDLGDTKKWVSYMAAMKKGELEIIENTYQNKAIHPIVCIYMINLVPNVFIEHSETKTPKWA
eukprot:499152_1